MTDPQPPGDRGHPRAEVRDAGRPLWQALMRHPSRMWWLTLASVMVAVVLACAGLWPAGTTLTIHFKQGHGIKPGDKLRHRGIDVGEVVAVRLSDDLEGVTVQVHVSRAAQALAREGTRFWIVRPAVSLARVRGLETIVGAKYLRVAPGPAGAPARRNFVGEEEQLASYGDDTIEIQIHFQQGHGLAVGDVLRHRGIVVGEVSRVAMDPRLAGVAVRVRLFESARGLARTGSQFWIVRPNVSLAGIEGLETLVGGRYLRVLPGPEAGEPLTDFDGLENPPGIIDRAEGGLEIVLEHPRRNGVNPGAPILFRGLSIGHVVAVELAHDATTIQFHAYVQPDYRNLIRDNTEFWVTSGFDVGFGLGGFRMNAETLETIATGGISCATPNDAGTPVATGHPFKLVEEDATDRDAWNPRMVFGPAVLAQGSVQPVRLSLAWQEKGLVRRGNRQRAGLAIPLDDGRIVAPANLLLPPGDALPDTARIEVAGQQQSLQRQDVTSLGALAVFPARSMDLDQVPRWSVDQLRAATKPENGLLLTAGNPTSVPLPASRLEAAEHGWTIDPSFAIDPGWHGAPLVATQDGKLIGVLIVGEEGSRIAAPRWP